MSPARAVGSGGSGKEPMRTATATGTGAPSYAGGGGEPTPAPIGTVGGPPGRVARGAGTETGRCPAGAKGARHCQQKSAVAIFCAPH
jgi:hypothetical protein